MTLSAKIDQIWQTDGSRREIARTLSNTLSDDELLQIAGHFWSARNDIEVRHAGIWGGNLRLETRAGVKVTFVTQRNVDGSSVVEFPDIGRGIFATEVPFGFSQRVDATNALLALQFARDRGDSLVYLPAELRRIAIEDAAAFAEISPELMLALIIRYPINERAFGK